MRLRNFIAMITCSTLLIACSTGEENKTGDSLSIDRRPMPVESCYRYAGEGDTVFLQITRTQDSLVTGTLTYRFKEKDKNTGTIKGVMKNNYLIAEYIFMSEAVESTRHVAFRLDDDGFTEGFGNALLDNKANFDNVSALEFSSKFKLSKIACE